MKTIVNKKASLEISIENLIGDEIIAYKCRSTGSNKDSYAILSRLHDNGTSPSYGFVAIGESNSKPRFMGKSWKAAVEIASQTRELKVFYTIRELLDAMQKNLF